MVSTVTSFSRSGLRDWVLQRFTAVVIATYTIMLLSFIFLQAPMSQEAWQSLFDKQWVKVFTFMTVFSIVIHAWIGMWTIYTDYVKPTLYRLALQGFTIFTLLTLLVWSAAILWGVTR